MSRIHSIVYQPKDKDRKRGERPVDYLRVPLEAATLIAGHGIEGDDKAGRNPRRQLNLLSFEWLRERKKEGYKTKPGSFGEQLIIKGLAVENLQRGDRLQLGEEACIEITFPRTGCERLEAAQGQSNKLLCGHIGMLAKVLTGGTIRVGDSVKLLSQARTKTVAS